MFINIQLFAHKKGLGSSRNNRDSESKRLGVKVSDGQSIQAGGIIVRQRGTPVNAGANAGVGRDHTIYATATGTVKFTRGKDNKKYASVITDNKKSA
ncbi:MAG: 50S ribosomal protein L27 [Firmicutes bacterium]|nr:50S ribosomal protein L27 [Bacillota bacterium]